VTYPEIIATHFIYIWERFHIHQLKQNKDNDKHLITKWIDSA